MLSVTWLLLAVLETTPQVETPATAREDAATLIRRVIEAQEDQQRAQRAFTFRERTVTRKLRGDGSVSGTESVSFWVTPSSDGDEYRRLVAKNGKPLSARDEAKESRKLEKHIKEQLRMTPGQREKETQDKLAKRVERYQTRLEEALEVYQFEPLSDEILDDQPLRVFRFTPTAGYEGHSTATKILARMEGTIWIDPTRDQLAKLSVAFTQDLTFLGGVFGRVSKGTRAMLVGSLHENWWLLDDVEVELNARLYFFKRYRQDITINYEDYRKFEVDTREEVSAPATGSQR